MIPHVNNTLIIIYIYIYDNQSINFFFNDYLRNNNSNDKKTY